MASDIPFMCAHCRLMFIRIYFDFDQVMGGEMIPCGMALSRPRRLRYQTGRLTLGDLSRGAGRDDDCSRASASVQVASAGREDDAGFVCRHGTILSVQRRTFSMKVHMDGLVRRIALGRRCMVMY